MITFYINNKADISGKILRDIQKRYIKKYLEPYGIEYQVVYLTARQNLTREFLLKVLALHDDDTNGDSLGVLTRTGLMDRNSPRLNNFYKRHKAETQEWISNILNKKEEVTLNEIVDMLVKYPVLCNAYFTYDDESNVFATRYTGDICRNAVRRKSRNIRRKMLMQEAMNSGLSLAEPGYE